MAERTLNDRQIEVLNWIGRGCPDGVFKGHSHKATAVALKSRRLVEIDKTRASWRAVLTQAGTYFLEHDAYPEGHWPTYERTDAPRSAAPPRSPPERRVTGTRPVEQLIIDVLAAGGELKISGEDAPRYKSLVSSATRYGKVPEGKLLKVESGSTWKEQFVRLTDQPAWMTAVLQPIPVTGSLRRPHAAVEQLRSSGITIRAAVRSRTLRILDALAQEAVRRDYGVRVSDWSIRGRREVGLLTFNVKGHDLRLDIDELNDRVPHVATATELRDAERYSWNRIPTHDQVPSGRLRIRVLNGWAVRQDGFTDTKTIDLVDRLPHVLQEVELRAHEAELRHIERQRQETERRTQWERAVEQAKATARDDALSKTLRSQVARWTEGKQIDNFLAELEERISEMTGQERSDAETWLEWARDYRVRLDPLNTRLAMPAEREFAATELAIFMPHGMSPYGP